MKIFKKIIAAVAAAAIAITALPMSAFGEDYWKTNAKTIQCDKEYRALPCRITQVILSIISSK